MHPSAEQDEAGRHETADAREWLPDYMASLPDGWARSKNIKAAARKARISDRTLERARRGVAVPTVLPEGSDEGEM